MQYHPSGRGTTSVDQQFADALRDRYAIERELGSWRRADAELLLFVAEAREGLTRLGAE